LPANSPDLNPVDYRVWGKLQGVQRRVSDLDDLKHRIRTEWTKLHHAVIAAAVHVSGAVVSQCPSRPAVVISCTVFDFDILLVLVLVR